MSFVGSMFSNSKGAGFQGSQAGLIQGANAAQAQETYKTAQDALAQQQAFTKALQSQGDQGMQTQLALTQALQNQAAGVGPNPAQAMLAQQTGANTANQAALMAGQRGASNNVGLIARQAAQQGAATQQQSAGQAATMQAQQQIAAQQQLQGLAGTQIGQQSGAISGYNQAAQGEQQNILNALSQYNSAAVGSQSSVNNANAGIAAGNAKFQQEQFAGAEKGAAAAASGGEVKKDKIGNNPRLAAAPANLYVPAPQEAPIAATATAPTSGPRSEVAKSFSKDAGNSENKSKQSGGSESFQGGEALGAGLRNLFSSSKPKTTEPAPVPAQAQSFIPANYTPAPQTSIEQPNPNVEEEGYQNPINNALSSPDVVSAGPSDMIGAANGGEIPHYDDGGLITPENIQMAAKIAPLLAASGGQIANLKENYYDEGGEVDNKDKQPKPENSSEPTPEEKALFNSLHKAFANPVPVEKKAAGGNVGNKLKAGGHVPGKAKVPGDSLKNDNVKALLSPGEIVVPRSVVHSGDPVNNAAKFVAAVLAKKGLPKRR